MLIVAWKGECVWRTDGNDRVRIHWKLMNQLRCKIIQSFYSKFTFIWSVLAHRSCPLLWNQQQLFQFPYKVSTVNHAVFQDLWKPLRLAKFRIPSIFCPFSGNGRNLKITTSSNCLFCFRKRHIGNELEKFPPFL